MQLNLNFIIKNLDGTPIEGADAGKTIANHLVKTSKGDILKHWEWAQRLYKGEPLDLNKSDSATLKKFISDSELAIIVKAQIIELFV